MVTAYAINSVNKDYTYKELISTIQYQVKRPSSGFGKDAKLNFALSNALLIIALF
jgi:hypothetical protein